MSGRAGHFGHLFTVPDVLQQVIFFVTQVTTILASSVPKSAGNCSLCYLVGGFNMFEPLWKMKEFVSWDDDIPNIWKFIKFMFQTTNQLYMWHSVSNISNNLNSKNTSKCRNRTDGRFRTILPSREHRPEVLNDQPIHPHHNLSDRTVAKQLQA